jgi:fructose-specific phosphotransferase system IIC component
MYVVAIVAGAIVTAITINLVKKFAEPSSIASGKDA